MFAETRVYPQLWVRIWPIHNSSVRPVLPSRRKRSFILPYIWIRPIECPMKTKSFESLNLTINTGVSWSRFINHFLLKFWRCLKKGELNLKQTNKDKKSRRQIIGRFEIIPLFSSRDSQTALCKQHLQILQNTKCSTAQVE